MRIALVVLGGLAFSAQAADPRPEIVRATGSPQAVGTVHTVRAIPEACVRLEGEFTGVAEQPYRFAVVRTSAACQARARFVDFAKAQPSVAGGWKFNDEIRIPSAACPSQQAVVRVWHKPIEVSTPELDEQGRARIYLHDAMAKTKRAVLPSYAAMMVMEGRTCSH